MNSPSDESDLLRRIADLDARVRELEAVQQLMLRIMSTTKPLGSVLEQYGATESQELAFYKLLDELAVRARGRDDDRPTFGYFEMKVAEIFPNLRGDTQFTSLLIDTMKLDRPAYRDLYRYATERGWPSGA
jgi:hypothetical protein